MLLQLLMSIIINPETLNHSRMLLKNSELQFASSLLKEKEFNDAVTDGLEWNTLIKIAPSLILTTFCLLNW